MTGTRDPEERQAAQMRLAAIVIAVTMLVWVGGSLAGGQVGVHPAYAFLLDFAALAAFVFAFAMVWRVWRARQENKD
ncbi:DUF5337 family protein [Acidimangrovimonas sediminis]|uniref:DUF5337 family protein n=1 Tax=Acidimangrovimonas sediminis TaxID=2056283 RepID=UPI000C809A7D|nr:DUF5337 family protein [Acidimangrovimonas sediminis]